MGEIRFVGTGETRGYPYLVCKKNFSSTTRAAEYRTTGKWKGNVVKSSVVAQQPWNVMGQIRLDIL